MTRLYVRKHELRQLSAEEPAPEETVAERTERERREREEKMAAAITLAFQRRRLPGEGKSW